jgi:hypothetical protein
MSVLCDLIRLLGFSVEECSTGYEEHPAKEQG